jgi:Flp pilus assembly protein protease CpaA
MSITSFLTIIALLVVYSILDIRYRKVKNEIVFIGGVAGCLILVLTEHFVYNMVLHLSALLLNVPLSYILFRIGSIGGADTKVLFTIALLSPGVELGAWSQPILEAIVGLGGELIVMLLGGFLYWKYKSKERSPPIIPILLMGYLIVQLFALF